MPLNRIQGQALKRRVDAAYLQPYGFRFQLSRVLPAEHQRQRWCGLPFEFLKNFALLVLGEIGGCSSSGVRCRLYGRSP